MKRFYQLKRGELFLFHYNDPGFDYLKVSFFIGRIAHAKRGRVFIAPWVKVIPINRKDRNCAGSNCPCQKF